MDSTTQETTMHPKFVGKKYEAGLDVTEIAKRMRRDIKAAMKEGKIAQGVKTRVRTERFAGGCSIDIRVTEVPFDVYDVEYLEEAYFNGGLENTGFRAHVDQFSQQMRQTMKALQNIHAAYKRDNSDIQTDYFDVNYYGQVALDPQKLPFLQDAYQEYVQKREPSKSDILREGALEQGLEVVNLDAPNAFPFGGEVEADGEITCYATGC